MSIIIRGMEMPTGCYSKHESCPCLQSMGDRIWCGVTLKEITDGYNKRQPDCPLIELPPHGRLIDADALGISYCNPAVFTDKNYGIGWNHAIDAITNAPTIIGAEGETE